MVQMATPGKKYKLFSSGDGRSPCAFFASEGGCRNGENCKFFHVLDHGAENLVNNARSSGSSTVSSESEPEAVDVLPTPASSEKGKSTKKRKVGNNTSTADIFAKPKNAGKIQKTSGPKSQNVEGGTGAIPRESLEKPLPQKSNGTKPKTKKVKMASTTPDFRALNLPIASFSTQTVEQTSPAPTPTLESDPGPKAAPVTSLLPLPVSTPEGRKWRETVIKTREHPRYAGSFDFKKFMEGDEELGRASSSDWIKCREWGSWCASNPQAIAIDCEMCETQDPVTGTTDGKALCRLSVVNAENPSEVLLDSLVKPAWPVVDYRSHINGIRKEHLDKVQFTLRHAQAFMLALCSDETVILGHALQNDLVALKMEHYCVVDSSLLFHVKDSPSSSPSLRDLAKAITQKTMPDTHDSVNDARTALACLEVYQEKGGKVDPIERSERLTRNPLASCQLFVHRIPKKCNMDHLSTMFLSHTFVNPKGVAEIEFSGDTGKTLITFSSPRHARLAFDTLDGGGEPDTSGRMQKRVYLRGGGYVRVRKMVHDRGQQTPGSKSD